MGKCYVGGKSDEECLNKRNEGEGMAKGKLKKKLNACPFSLSSFTVKKSKTEPRGCSLCFSQTPGRHAPNCLRAQRHPAGDRLTPHSFHSGRPQNTTTVFFRSHSWSDTELIAATSSFQRFDATMDTQSLR